MESKHVPCERCGSSDAGTIYPDGHFFCFSCNTYVGNANDPGGRKTTARSGLIPFECHSLPKRKISEETCRKFRYGVADYCGEMVQAATYVDASGQPVAQKIRTALKDFCILGSMKDALLFGQQVWASGGKRVIVTEGEIDCLSVAEVIPGWPVVSIPTGAQGAVKVLAKQLEWLESFQEIVLCFDMDEPGQKASKVCAELFTPGKCRIASLPRKDASEMLQAGERDELRKALWFNAQVYRPDGIVCGDDPGIEKYIVDFKAHADAHYPWPSLDEAMYGMRRGELVTHTAGTGIGKSTICREIAYDLGVKQGRKVGIVALEENVKRVGLFLAEIHAKKRLHLEDAGLSPEEKSELFRQSIGNGNFYLYDHWGSTDTNNLLSRIRYMVKGLGCEWIILDHISIVVSGMDGGDERKDLDLLMTRLRSMVEETRCGMHLISHLSRKHDGKSHEEGAPISLRDLRGSHSIVQLSDIVLGYERNQQDANRANLLRVRKLKDRYSGETGLAGELVYDEETGRVLEATEFPDLPKEEPKKRKDESDYGF